LEEHRTAPARHPNCIGWQPSTALRPQATALARAGVRFPPRPLLFRKAFLTLLGVLSDLCPACPPEAALAAEALAQFAWEWPLRWWKPLGDRGYGTHVSSADLVHLALRHARQFCLPAAPG
jgi:hypothetical protein